MAIIKKHELKKMGAQQLLEKKRDLQKEMMKVGAQLSTKTTPENPGRIRAVKKTIARINTFLTQTKGMPKKEQSPQKEKLKEVRKKNL